MLPVSFVAVAILGPAREADLRVAVGDPPVPAGAVRLGSPRFRGGTAERVHFSRDGKLIATSGYGGVFVYDAATGRRLLAAKAPPDRYPGSAAALGFGPAGELVVGWYPQARTIPPGELVRIDVPSGRILSRHRPADRRRYAALTPDGRRVASVAQPGDNARDTVVVVDDTMTGKELWRRPIPNVFHVGVAADGSRVFAWPNGTARIELVETETGRPAEVTDYAPRRDPGAVALLSAAGPLVSIDWFNGILDVRKPGADRPTHLFKPRYRGETPVFSPDAQRAVFTSHTGFEVWDAVGWKKLAEYPTTALGGSGHAAISPDGQTLAGGGYHSTLVLYDLANGARRRASADPAGNVDSLQYDPAGRLVARFSVDGGHAWDTTAGAWVRLPHAPPGPPAGFTDAGTGQPVREVRVEDAGVYGGEYTPDGKYLLAGRSDPEPIDSAPDPSQYWLGLYDGKTGKLVRRMPPADGLVRLAPDGKTYVIAHAGRGLVFYDLLTGDVVRRLWPGSHVLAMTFRPDGRQLATAHPDGPVLVWELGR